MGHTYINIQAPYELNRTNRKIFVNRLFMANDGVLRQLFDSTVGMRKTIQQLTI